MRALSSATTESEAARDAAVRQVAPIMDHFQGEREETPSERPAANLPNMPEESATQHHRERRRSDLLAPVSIKPTPVEMQAAAAVLADEPEVSDEVGLYSPTSGEERDVRQFASIVSEKNKPNLNIRIEGDEGVGLESRSPEVKSGMPDSASDIMGGMLGGMLDSA